MADSFIGIDEPTTIDKKADTEQLLVGANTVQRERIQVSGATDVAIAAVQNSAPSTEYGLVTRNIPSGTQGTNPTGETAGVGVGAAADAEAAANGSVIAVLKRLRTLLAGGLPAALVGGRLDVNVGNSPTVDTELTTADLDTGAGTDTRAVVGLVRAESGGGALVGSANPLPVVVQTALPAGANNIGDVDVLTLPALPAGTNNIGDVDVLTLPAGVIAGMASLPAGANNIGDVDILTIAAGDNNIGNVDIVTMPNVTLAAGTNTNEVVGDAAHDAAVAGNPVLNAAYAETPDDTAPGNEVSAEGDVVRFAADRDGALYTHPHPPRIWHASNEYATAQTDTSVKAAPGVGLSLYITDIYLACNAAVNVTLEEGTTTLKWKYYASGQGDGVALSLSVPIKLTANTALTVTTSGAVSVTLVVTGFTAP